MFIILKSSVEHVRVCGFWVAWRGAPRRMAVPCNEEQRGRVIQKSCNWARSSVTHWVSTFETIRDNNLQLIKDHEAVN